MVVSIYPLSQFGLEHATDLCDHLRNGPSGMCSEILVPVETFAADHSGRAV
jgi:hypothetical protein